MEEEIHENYSVCKKITWKNDFANIQTDLLSVDIVGDYGSTIINLSTDKRNSFVILYTVDK